MLHAMNTREYTSELQQCLNCVSELVYPVEWEPAGRTSWSVLLRCPNCEVHRLGLFEQGELDAFDAQLDQGDALLREAYERLVRENMTAEIGVFAQALAAGAILPEDF
jgi:hypothetical protein